MSSEYLNPQKVLRFLVDAQAAASHSKDPSTKVGAILLDQEYGIASSGWNGFARRVSDDPARYLDRTIKLKMVVHAEANAVANAARRGRTTFGSELLLTSLFPCTGCTGILINAGIRAVHIPVFDHTNAAFQRWKADYEITKLMLQEAGVIINEY